MGRNKQTKKQTNKNLPRTEEKPITSIPMSPKFQKLSGGTAEKGAKPPPRSLLGTPAEKEGDSTSKSHGGRVLGGQPRSRGFETPDGGEGGKKRESH